MTALDELRAALENERIICIIAPWHSRAKERIQTDAALAHVEAELAELRKRPTMEQVIDAVNGVPSIRHRQNAYASQAWYTESRPLVSAIRALYGEAETTERPNG